MEMTKENNVWFTLVETLHQELKAKGKVDLADVIQTVFDKEKAEWIITEIKKALDKYEKDKQKEQLNRALKEVVIQSYLGDPKARKIIQDIEELAEKSKIKASVQ